jgi:oxygen-independent coproporphyrinogen-3 oxidase
VTESANEIATKAAALPPACDAGLGIYVHWPFCAAKCPYCDFNSHVRVQIDPDAWERAIRRELAFTAELQGRDRPRAQSVFFGGGTPSLASGRSIGNILDEIARRWGFSRDAEITLEANPASAEAGRFRDYRAAGVNRVSVGIQALNDADLKFLGRLHDVEEAKAALKAAMQTFSRVSLDLIYARPDQTVAAWRRELTEALAFDTEHLSLYQLTIEPGTPFAALARTGSLALPDEDTAAALYDATQEVTESAGLPAYEISNHARPGDESRHNLLYWRYGDYVGVGPGAHGRLTLADRRIATAAEKLPERWQEAVLRDGNGLVERMEIEARDAAREHLLMNLRLAEGIDVAAYRARWDVELDTACIDALSTAGLVRQTGTRLAVTTRGRLVLNAIIAELAPPRSGAREAVRRTLS